MQNEIIAEQNSPLGDNAIDSVLYKSLIAEDSFFLLFRKSV